MRLLALTMLIACGSDAEDKSDTGQTSDTGNAPTGNAPNPSGDWVDCEPINAQMAADPECKTYDVPLRWEAADTDPTIAFTVYRYLTDAAEPAGQVWALDGGPGGSGSGPGNPEFVDAMNALGFDLYIPSQRGTSGPDALSCTDAFDYAACHDELVAVHTVGGLTGFASGQAALDTQMALGDADEGGPQLLFGTSYGTYLAMRILQIDDEIDAAVLDSSMTLEPDIWNAGRYTNDVVVDLFDACIADSSCAARFPGGSVADALALVDDANHCTAVDVDGRGELIGFMVRLFPAVPLALTSRLARCDQEDIEVFDRLESFLSNAPAGASWVYPDDGAFNSSTYVTVVAHDFLPSLTQARYDEAIADSDGLLFGNAGAADLFWSMKSAFPVQDGFEADQTVPDTTPPILVLQGGVDLQTPPAWGERASDSLGGVLVTIPEAGHGVYPQNVCAQSVTDAFLVDPTAPLDLACVDAIGTPDFGEPQDPYLQGFLQFALGVDQLWPTL